MRTTDSCFPLLQLRAPAPRQSPASFRSLRRALGSTACTVGQEAGGPSVSRRSIRFGGLARFRDDGVFLPCASVRTEPLALVSLSILGVQVVWVWTLSARIA